MAFWNLQCIRQTLAVLSVLPYVGHQLVPSWHVEKRRSYVLGSALESVLVDERVGEFHDVLVHAVLVLQVDKGLGMTLGQPFEQTNVHTALP